MDRIVSNNSPIKLYYFVGPQKIREMHSNESIGKRIGSIRDMENWFTLTKQRPNNDNEIVVTFVINKEEQLVISDRRTEHFACAGGQPVLSAGEMSFSPKSSTNEIEVVQVSNLSTGYCPEPASWTHVRNALDKINIKHPDDFTSKFIFRQCQNCGQVSVVKNTNYKCEVCDSDLPMGSK